MYSHLKSLAFTQFTEKEIKLKCPEYSLYMLLLSHVTIYVTFTSLLSLQVFSFKTLLLQLLHCIFLEQVHCSFQLRSSGLLLLSSVKLIIPVSFMSLADVES